MLRAAALLSLLRRILRFSTTGRPAALGACYVASWQLPRLDSHQLADDSLQGTPATVRPPLIANNKSYALAIPCTCPQCHDNSYPPVFQPQCSTIAL